MIEPNPRLVTLVKGSDVQGPSRHYVGLPPMGANEIDTRRPMSVARFLVLECRVDGVFLDRFDESGQSVGDTWHESIDDAKAQAAVEYGPGLGSWVLVPDSQMDPFQFVAGLRDEEVGL